MTKLTLADRVNNAFDGDNEREIVDKFYLNQIYLGHGAYGVAAAAQSYFGKPIEEVNLAESALLAGLPQAPTKYSPHHHPELRLQHLAVIVLGQGIDKAVFPRPLEASNAAQAQRLEHPLGDICAGAAHHHGHHLLAPFGVRPSDHGHLVHAGALEQDLLDLARIDVGAAADDHVLGAVLERKESVCIQ